MRSSPRGAARISALAVGAWLISSPARADVATATATLHVQVQARTALRLSSPTLQFFVTDPARPAAEALLEFEAAARTRPGGVVVLTVEPAGPLEGPHGAADVDARLSFAGEGEGTERGILALRGSQVVARWMGSGKRRGQIRFALEGAVNPGVYTLPLRVVLTAP
jgi:hypothetical protein